MLKKIYKRPYKGVYLHTKKYKDKIYTYWVAQFKLTVNENGKRQKTIFIGSFNTPERAALAYNEASREYSIKRNKLNVL